MTNLKIANQVYPVASYFPNRAIAKGEEEIYLFDYWGGFLVG